ncbi:MAG: hypothetical protein L6Q38_16825, partial [Nitrospira sp.]|nr:hypothetical protein [Nitrospira sp.]
MKILPSLLGSIFVSVFAHLAVFAVPVDLTPGVLDPSFTPGSGANNTVTTAVIGPDDAIWIGGRFTEVDGQGRYGVARLNPNGAVDPTFVSPLGPSDEVQALAVLPDNMGIVASLRTADTNLAIAFIPQDGGGVRKLDFDPNIVIRSAHAVSSIVVLGDGETIVTADWDGLVFFRPDGAGGYSQRRITAFGSSTAFDPSIASLTVDGSGRPMVAGAFSSIDGSVQSYFARFLPNGDLDPAFRPNVPFTPPAPMMGFTFWGATTLTDGSVVSADIVNRQFFRLSPEGEIDPDFERTTLPNLGTPLYPTVIRNPRVVPLPNQYTLFYSVDPRFTSHGYASYMYRVRSDGSLASGWEVVFSPTDGIQDVVADRRGNVIMVGSFTNVLGSPLRGVARLHGGAVDAPPVLPAPPARIEIREGDDVVLPLHPTSFADPFTAQWFLGNSPIADQTNPRLAVRSIRPDQAGLYSLQVSNRFGSTRTPATEIVVRPYPIQRGAVDLNFERPLLTSIIPQVALRQPDGKWLVSGRWSPQNLFGVNSLSPFTLRRLLANGPLDP